MRERKELTQRASMSEEKINQQCYNEILNNFSSCSQFFSDRVNCIKQQFHQ